MLAADDLVRGFAHARIRSDGTCFHLPGGQVFRQCHRDGGLTILIRFHLRLVEGGVAKVLADGHHAQVALAFSASAAAQDDAERSSDAEGAFGIETAQHRPRIIRGERQHSLVHQRQGHFGLRGFPGRILDRYRVSDLVIRASSFLIRLDAHVQLLSRQIHVEARHPDLEIGCGGGIRPLMTTTET